MPDTNMARQERRDSRRTLGLMLLISLCTLWVLAAYDISRARNTDLREAENISLFQAQAFAENTLSLVLRVDQMLYDLRDRWRSDPGSFDPIVQRQHAVLADVTFQIAVIDANGWLAYSNLATTGEKVYLGDREHFKALSDGTDRLFISKPVKGRVSGKWSVQFVRPILRQGRFSGVVVASIAPEQLVEFHSKIKGRVALGILADDGTVMTRMPMVESLLGKKTNWAFMEKREIAAGNFIQRSSVDDIERIYGYRRLAGQGLYFLIGYDMEDALNNSRLHATRLLFAVAIISLGLIMLFVQLYRSRQARAASEAELRESQSMLRSAVDTIGEAFVIYDKEDRLVYCNQQYREYYPKSADLLVPGARFEDILRIGAERGQYPEAVGRVEEWLKSRLAEHRGGAGDLIQHLDDGRWLRIRERIMPGGMIVGFRIDITELYEAKRAAEAASEAKSRFLAVMSHEVRTPMNGILGMAQMLTMPGLSEEECQEFAQVILNSGNDLLTLLNDILDLSKIEAGKFDLAPIEFSPARLLKDAAALFSGSAREKGLELDATWSGAEGAYYIADSARLRQMLSNLIGNAVKFTARGFIRIECRPVEGVADAASVASGDAAEPAGNRTAILEFAVTDSGIGIAPEKLSGLFQPFSQADGSITREYGGTGLGLSIVRRLAELMGGQAGVTSTPGEGSRFWFRVRVEQTPAGSAPLATACD